MLRKSLILLLIFITVYLAAHFYIRGKNRATLDSVKVSKLIDCEQNQVRSIRVSQKNKSGKETILSFERTDQPAAGLPVAAQLAGAEWAYKSPLSGEADASILNRIAAKICEQYEPIPIRAEDVGEPTASGDKSFAIKLEFQLTGDAQTRALRFGAIASDRQSMAEYTENNKSRFVKIAPELFNITSLPPADFLNLRVMKMNLDNIQRAAFFFDGKEKFILERAGADWTILSDSKFRGAASENAIKYVNRIGTLRAVGILSSEYTREQCAAGKHAIRVELSGVGERSEILQFDVVKNKEKYLSACSTERKALFRVHQDLLNYLLVPMKELIEPSKAH